MLGLSRLVEGKGRRTPAAAPAAGKRRGRFGINARLTLAFAAVAATTLIASGVAWLSYGQVETALARVTQGSLPATTASLQLAEKTTALVGAAPRILSAETQEGREAATRAVYDGIRETGQYLEALAAAGVDGDTIGRIREQLDEISANIRQLDSIQAARIDAAAKVAEAAAAAGRTHAQYRSGLATVAEDAFYSITVDLGSAVTEQASDGVDVVSSGAKEAIGRVVDEYLPLYQTAFELRVASDGLNRLFEEARGADEETLARLARTFEAEQRAFANRMSLAADVEGMAAVRELGKRLAGFGSGTGGLFALRGEELRVAAEAATLVQRNRRPAATLVQEVKTLVAAAEEGADGAAAATDLAIDRGKAWLLALAGASALAALLIGWLYVRRNLIRRLAALGQAMRAIADGDLKAEIPSGGRDEITEMAAALVVFRDTAAEVEAANRRTEAEREAAAEARRQELHKLAGEFEATVKRVVDAVSAAAHGLRGTAEGLVDLTRQTTDQANAVVAASENASGNVGTVASAAEELSHSVEEIGQQVAHSARIARQAVDQASRTNGSVKSLQEAAQKIGEIVDFISGIAAQTNLLALNATIEAARAGEAGKGFAVVASEVKSLANQTANATEQIAAQIAAIQSATGDAVGAIDAIGKTIAEIDEIAATIAAAVEEQGAATQEIARNTQQAALGTQEVSSHIVGVTGATERTGRAAGGVLDAAGGLAAECERLNEAVAAFLEQVRAA